MMPYVCPCLVNLGTSLVYEMVGSHRNMEYCEGWWLSSCSSTDLQCWLTFWLQDHRPCQLLHVAIGPGTQFPMGQYWLVNCKGMHRLTVSCGHVPTKQIADLKTISVVTYSRFISSVHTCGFKSASVALSCCQHPICLACFPYAATLCPLTTEV